MSGLTNGTSYSFTVTATSVAGSSVPSPPVSATPVWIPTAPTDFTVTPGIDHQSNAAATGAAFGAGAGFVTLNWSPPASDNGSPITGYFVQVTDASGSPPSFFDVSPLPLGPTDTTARVDGLFNGKPYTFTIGAINGVGNGPFVSPSITVTPLGPPDQPTAVSATGGVTAAPSGTFWSGTAQVDWTPPANDGGSPITGYVVSYDGGEAGVQSQQVAGAAHSALLTGLDYIGQAYSLNVQAINAQGAGLASSSVSATPQGPPFRPQDVGAYPADGEINVDWSVPNSGPLFSTTGGQPILYYTAAAQGDDGSGVVSKTVVPTINPDGTLNYPSLTGLTNGVRYTVWVTATNAIGTSAATLVYDVTPDGPTPPPPSPGGGGGGSGVGPSSPPTVYAAIGDSFSSGDGNPPFVAGTFQPQEPYGCHRSTASYPYEVAQSLGFAAGSFIDFACSGATTDDFWTGTTSLNGSSEGAQGSHVGFDDKLVTVSIGGNDVDFPNLIAKCVGFTNSEVDKLRVDWKLVANGHDPIWNGDCSNTNGTLEAAITQLARTIGPDGRTELERVYANIVRDAPRARVLVVGYPRFFPVQPVENRWQCQGIETDHRVGLNLVWGGISQSEQAWVNAKILEVDNLIQQNAAAVGVEYVDTYNAFNGAELCSGHLPDMNGIVPGGDQTVPFHPNAVGQQALARLVLDHLHGTPPTFNVSNGQVVPHSFEIAGGDASVTFGQTWLGSDMVLSLTSPSGRVIDRSTTAPDVVHTLGPTFESYEILNPEPGAWTAQTLGADVAPAGEPVTLSSTESVPPPASPTATITESGATGPAPLTVTFDGTKSTAPPDSAINGYHWDFGDGTTADGPSASHVYGTSGSYSATLVVTDDQGYAGSASANVTVGATVGETPSTPSSPNPSPAPAPASVPSVSVLAGADRIATAIKISQADFADATTAVRASNPRQQAGAVVLADGLDDHYTDALVGVPLAVAKVAPILLTQPGSLAPTTGAEIQRVLPRGGTVYLLGQLGALSAAVENTLTGMGYQTIRLGGLTRYDTATIVADQGLADPSSIIETTGQNFPDALSAGAAAAHIHGAVLLTAGTSAGAVTSAYLAAHASDRRWAVGGPAALADPTATPLVGIDRYQTAVDVMQTFFSSPAFVGIASGVTAADGLGGGADAAYHDGPLLLTTPSALAPPTEHALLSGRATIHQLNIYGGANAVSSTVVAAVPLLFES